MAEISVIVPAYNVGEYLAESLDSLLSQSFRDFEAIIVDDGSTDATPAIIDRYCKVDSRLRCIRQPNAGVSTARNVALAQARGRYVCFLDGDDLFTPGALQALYRRAVETNADLVIGDYEIFDSLHSWGVKSMRTLFEQNTYDRFDQNLLLCYVVWNKLFRRSVIEEHGLQFAPVSFAEDGVFSMAFAYRSNKIVTLDEVVCRYRRRSYASELSATQVITMRSETDHLEAHAAVRRDAVAHLDEWVAEANGDEPERRRRLRTKASYLDGLLGKEVANLIDLRYRTFWNAESGVAALIADRVEHAREGMSYKTWSDLCKSVRDLPLGHLPRNRSAVSAMPLITVAVFATPAEAADLEQTLHSLYIQGFPRFQVYVPEGALLRVAAHYTAYENLVALPEDDEASFYNAALKRGRTEFFLFARAGFLYRSTALLRMFSALKNGNSDLATFPVARVSDVELPALYPTQRVAFEAHPESRDYRSDRNHRFDCLLANKLVRRSYLDTLKFAFTGDTTADAERMLSEACFLKSEHRVIYTPLDAASFVNRFAGGRVRDRAHRLKVLADQILPMRRRRSDVLFFDTEGQGFSQNLLSLRDAAIAAGLTPRYAFTDLRDDIEPKPLQQTLVQLRRLLWRVPTLACATDSLDALVPPALLGQKRVIVQTPRISTVHGRSRFVGGRYTDVIVQSEAFDACTRGRRRVLGLPATDVLQDESRQMAARSRLAILRPDARDRKILVFTSHFDAELVFSGVDIDRLSNWLRDEGWLMVASVPGLAEMLADEPASLSDTIFDATGCFLSFDQMMMADVFVTTRFAEIVYRSASRLPVLFWTRDEETGRPGLDLPESLQRMSLADLDELPGFVAESPWTGAVDEFADYFIGDNTKGNAARGARLLMR
ncbi:MAG TPA: glycosyltransferase [Coriobacteriia bacterium]|nr:glycosyltransferase [Coriobacteriia bacterium]